MVLPPQKATFFPWHPSTPVTEEIFDDEDEVTEDKGAPKDDKPMSKMDELSIAEEILRKARSESEYESEDIVKDVPDQEKTIPSTNLKNLIPCPFEMMGHGTCEKGKACEYSHDSPVLPGGPHTSKPSLSQEALEEHSSRTQAIDWKSPPRAIFKVEPEPLKEELEPPREKLETFRKEFEPPMKGSEPPKEEPGPLKEPDLDFEGISKAPRTIVREKAPPTSEISQAVRDIMRHMPAPIVILTSTLLTHYGYDHHGMTISSFTTLSLSPEPVVSFNIRTNNADPSRTLTAIQSSRQFLVHIVDASWEGAKIASIFTNSARRRPAFGQAVKDVLESLVWIQNVAGKDMVPLPRLHGAGVGQVLRCEVLTEGVAMPTTENPNGPQTNGSGFVRVGDHVLVIARVLEILGEQKKWGNDEDVMGLSYLDREYQLPGRSIPIVKDSAIRRTRSSYGATSPYFVAKPLT